MSTAVAIPARARVRAAVPLVVAVALLATGCANAGAVATPPPPAPSAPPIEPQTLAMVDGWRAGLADPDGRSVAGAPDDAFGVLEVAYDAATARALWDAVVPPDLPARPGDPYEPGLYGDLADVDLDEQAVVLWSSGESGTCASWFTGVSTGPSGAMEVSQGGQGGTCTTDYREYQVVVAVDRDDLPVPADLATARATFDGTEEDSLPLVVTAFPCCHAP